MQSLVELKLLPEGIEDLACRQVARGVPQGAPLALALVLGVPHDAAKPVVRTPPQVVLELALRRRRQEVVELGVQEEGLLDDGGGKVVPWGELVARAQPRGLQDKIRFCSPQQPFRATQITAEGNTTIMDRSTTPLLTLR